MPKSSELNENNETPADILKDTWAIRPCEVYKEEYDDCTSIKARFHQYFIHGEDTDCSQWQIDYKNCLRYEESNGNDVQAGAAIIKSEEERRRARMQAHYANTTWEKRKEPPKDWASPLPEFFAKRNENTYLEIKQAELEGKRPIEDEAKSYCSIM